LNEEEGGSMRVSASILFLAMVFFLLKPVYAQEQHPKKVYFDSKNKKVFWPVGKQFFIKLSESADSSAPSFLLGSKDSSKGYPLYLSGLHSLRWIEPFKADTTMLFFTADGEKPRCQMALKGTRYTLDGKNFYGRGLVAVFTTQDRYSGVENVLVSLDSAKFLPVSDSLPFDKEKDYSVRYYAVDRVGNYGNPRSAEFSVDLTAPVTTLSVNETALQPNVILSKNQDIIVKAVDSLSGVKETWYRFDQSEQFSRTVSSISLVRLKDGEHLVSFYSIDNVGIAEILHTTPFFIDNTPPATQVTFDGDHYISKSGVDLISTRTTLKVDASDNKSGIEKIEYALSNDQFIPYTAPFNLLAQGGKTVVSIRALDKKGNVCPIKYYTLQVDSKSPQSKCTITGPVYKNNSISYITSQSKLSLSSTDDLTGIKNIAYMSGDTRAVIYSEPFSISGDGRVVVRYSATDNVNNKEDTQAVVVVIDNTPPKIIETFSDANASLLPDQSSIRVSRSTSLFLAATDNAAGVSDVMYSFEGKKEQKYLGPIVFDTKGIVNLTLRCKDNVGNTAEKKLTVEVND
jgi:hypothetical protein